MSSNRGSELWDITRDGPVLLQRRETRPGEDEALDRAAAAIVSELDGARARDRRRLDSG